jgi:hypothetical protein
MQPVPEADSDRKSPVIPVLLARCEKSLKELFCSLPRQVWPFTPDENLSCIDSVESIHAGKA